MEQWPQNISQFKKWAIDHLGGKLFLHYDRRKAVRKVVTIVEVNHTSVHFLDEEGHHFKVDYPRKGHFKFTRDWFSFKTMVFKYDLPKEKIADEPERPAPPAEPTAPTPEPVKREQPSKTPITTSDLFHQLWGLAEMHGYDPSQMAIELPRQNREFLERVAQLNTPGGMTLTPPMLIIGIPLYGDLGPDDRGIEDVRMTGARTWNEYYIARSLDILEPGGLVICLLRADLDHNEKLYLHSGMNVCKQSIAGKSQVLDAYRLPAAEYKGKRLDQEIIVIRKTL